MASYVRRRLFSLWIVVLLALALPDHRPAAQSSEPDPVFEASGFQKNRQYFSQMPFESIDLVSGNLILTFTDLVLPGNAGMDLRFTRTYNLNGRPKWSFGIANVPLLVRGPDGPAECGVGVKFPRFATADGGEQTAFPRTPYPAVYPQTCWPLDTVFITSDFWRWDRTSRVLQLPNGWTVLYSSTMSLPGGINPVAYAEELRDPFNNVISFEWEGDHPKRLWRVHQWFGGEERLVQFNHDDPVLGLPRSMTFEGRQWSYDGGGSNLTSVTPPVGPGWGFDYSDGLKVTTPSGGQTHYRFETHQFIRFQPAAPGTGESGPGPKERKEVNTVVVGSRTVIDGSVLGEWNYDYGHDGENETVTITDPENRRTTYTNTATSQLSWEFAPLYGYVPGKRTLTIDKGSGTEILETEEWWYRDLPIGDDGFASIGDESELERRVLTRGGQTYETFHHFSGARFDDYHRPFKTEETGDAGTRTTEFGYDYEFGPWIRDRSNHRRSQPRLGAALPRRRSSTTRPDSDS